MAHLAILCPPLPGHLNPMGVLARELIERGHRVTFLGFPDMRSKLSEDFDFVAFGGDDQPEGSLASFLDRLSRLGGLFSIRRLISDLAGFADTICKMLPSALHELNPDALIIDQSESSAGLVAKALQIPFATVANALPLNAEPSIPPPFLPWAYDPSPQGIRRNLGGYRIAGLIERPIRQTFKRHAKMFGLADARYPDGCWSDICQLTQCFEGLDFPRIQLPSNFHYVGPFRKPDREAPLNIPLSGRPLAFCSFGTLQGSRRHLFEAVARAALDLKLDLLIAHGGRLSKDEAQNLPGRPIVRSFVTQRAVLKQSVVAITHAGFNTVLDALSSATPMVALPLAFEQPGTAARLQRCGVAEAIYRRPSSFKIRSALGRVLQDSSYGTNAKALSEEIRSTGGVSRAADLLEQAFGIAAPTAGATKVSLAQDGARDDTRNGSRS